MKITAIFPPYVFIEDDEGKTDRKELKDFNGSPKLLAPVQFNLETKLYDVLQNTANEDCVGGVCPIR